MDRAGKVLLLVGSPKGMSSASATLGSYVLRKLEREKLETEVLHIHSELKSENKEGKLLEAVVGSDLILLTFPLYVDTLPAPVIRTFELIAEDRSKNRQLRKQKLIAIVNSGFPEASQNRFAISVCRQFALETGMQWMGGLALGMGGAVIGKSLGKAGGNNLTKSLDLVTESIIQGKEIPQKAIDYMAVPFVPSKWLYVFVGNTSWRMLALKNKVYSRLWDKPFTE